MYLNTWFSVGGIVSERIKRLRKKYITGDELWIIIVSPLIQFTSFAFCLWLRLWALSLPAPWCYASSSWCGTIEKKIHSSISFFWSWCFIHSNRKITNATIKLLQAKDGESEQEELCLKHWGQKKRDRAFKCFKKSY